MSFSEVRPLESVLAKNAGRIITIHSAERLSHAEIQNAMVEAHRSLGYPQSDMIRLYDGTRPLGIDPQDGRPLIQILGNYPPLQVPYNIERRKSSLTGMFSNILSGKNKAVREELYSKYHDTSGFISSWDTKRAKRDGIDCKSAFKTSINIDELKKLHDPESGHIYIEKSILIFAFLKALTAQSRSPCVLTAKRENTRELIITEQSAPNRSAPSRMRSDAHVREPNKLKKRRPETPVPPDERSTSSLPFFGHATVRNLFARAKPYPSSAEDHSLYRPPSKVFHTQDNHYQGSSLYPILSHGNPPSQPQIEHSASQEARSLSVRRSFVHSAETRTPSSRAPSMTPALRPPPIEHTFLGTPIADIARDGHSEEDIRSLHPSGENML